MEKAVVDRLGPMKAMQNVVEIKNVHVPGSDPRVSFEYNDGNQNQTEVFDMAFISDGTYSTVSLNWIYYGSL